VPLRYTPSLVAPSPFQSPTTGTSPDWPIVTLTSAADQRPSPSASRYQVPLWKMPMLDTPSPFQSPVMGTWPSSPYRNTWSMRSLRNAPTEVRFKVRQPEVASSGSGGMFL